MEADAEEQARATWTQWRSLRHRRWNRQAIGEAVSEDLVTLSEAVVAKAWSQTWRSGRVRHGPGNGR
jgi:hypothetical protein